LSDLLKNTQKHSKDLYYVNLISCLVVIEDLSSKIDGKKLIQLEDYGV